jgi:hypothetical protein
MAVARDGVTDMVIAVSTKHTEEDAVVAAVEGPRIEGVVGLRSGEGGHCCGEDEAASHASFDSYLPVDEAEERRGSVEVAVPAEEGGVGEGAEEPRGLVRREAEQDLGGLDRPHRGR